MNAIHFQTFVDISVKWGNLTLGWPKSSGGLEWSTSNDHNFLHAYRIQSKQAPFELAHVFQYHYS